jgi:hypothetical protein
MQIEQIEYGAYGAAWRVANGDAELILTSGAGPRIIRYGFIGGQNFFREWPDGKGLTFETSRGPWHIMGGHRLWVAPEIPESTYSPDPDPVTVRALPDGVHATGAADQATRIRKEMIVTMDPAGAGVRVLHRITNEGPWPIEAAIWVLSVMAQRGVGVTGFPPRGTHPEVLPPSNPLIMWAFTDFTDPRLTLTHKYLVLRQDPENPAPQKLGHFNRDTWGAYLLNGEAFLKRTEGLPGRRYPDMGASFEIFTNHEFLELETLGPLSVIDPGASVEHIENWSLHRNVSFRAASDEALDETFARIL